MRGEAERQVAILLGVVADDLVPQDHPLRAIRRVVDRALGELSPTFAAMDATGDWDGRSRGNPVHARCGGRRPAVGGDNGDDQHPFVDACRDMNVTPRVAQKQIGSAVDGRTTRHAGYKVSQTIRKRVEAIVGWDKTVGCCRKRRFRGVRRARLWVTLTATVFNVVRVVNLERAAGAGA